MSNVMWLVACVCLLAGCGDSKTEAEGTKEVSQACCTDEAETCDADRFGTCSSGLTCYVLPGGMYMDTGVCCGGSSCQYSCDHEQCSTGMCAVGELCPDELTCRPIGVGDYCLP